MTPEQANLFLTIGGALALIALGFVRVLGRQSSQNDARKSEITQLQNDLETERRTARDHRQRIDDLQRQLDGSNNLLREVDRTNANLTGRLTEQREIYSKQLTDQSNDIALLRKMIAERDTQNTALTKTIEDFKTAQRTNDQRHTEDIATIEALRGELQKATEDVVKLTRRVDELKAQVDEMQQELSRRDIELADKDRQIVELTIERDALKAEIASLKAAPLPESSPLASITSADPVIASTEAPQA